VPSDNDPFGHGIAHFGHAYYLGHFWNV
jgi:hypothetical protein